MTNRARIVPQSSVLFAATLSQKGGSAKIIQGCKQGLWVAYISTDIIDEVSENLHEKYPDYVENFFHLLDTTHFIIIKKISDAKIEHYKNVIADIDDAHILALVSYVKANYLITLDEKHFIRNKQVAKKTKFTIVTPKTFLATMRQNEKHL